MMRRGGGAILSHEADATTMIDGEPEAATAMTMTGDHRAVAGGGSATPKVIRKRPDVVGTNVGLPDRARAMRITTIAGDLATGMTTVAGSAIAKDTPRLPAEDGTILITGRAVGSGTGKAIPKRPAVAGTILITGRVVGSGTAKAIPKHRAVAGKTPTIVLVGGSVTAKAIPKRPVADGKIRTMGRVAGLAI